MGGISLDRMSLTLSGMSATDGERLARLIGERLAAASMSVRGSGRLASVNVEMPAANGMGLDELAEKLVEELIRQVNRTI